MSKKQYNGAEALLLFCKMDALTFIAHAQLFPAVAYTNISFYARVREIKLFINSKRTYLRYYFNALYVNYNDTIIVVAYEM
jgi:hypothetical protein